MRTETREIFKFSELSDDAQERALEQARVWFDFGWSAEYADSLKAFCDEFGADVTSWNVGPYQNPDYSHNAKNEHFRGRKLREFDPQHMPTGFCADCELWETFHREFKRTGDAKGAFDSAMWEFFKAWRDDWEDALSDEQLGEYLQANEHEYTADGEEV
jgi:hypothetical protein